MNLESDGRRDGVPLVLTDRELLDHVPEFLRLPALHEESARDRRSSPSQHVGVACDCRDALPSRGFDADLGPFNRRRIERDRERQAGIEEDVVIDVVLEPAPVVLGVDPHCAPDRFAHADFDEMPLVGRNRQNLFDSVQPQAGPGTAQQQVLGRGRLEDPVVGGIQLESRRGNEVAGREARAERAIRNQQAVLVETEADAGCEVAGPQLVVSVEAGLGAALPVAEVQIEVRQFVGLRHQEAFPEPAGSNVPADLECMALSLERHVGNHHALAEPAILRNVDRRRQFVAPKFAGQVPQHPADRYQRPA